MGKNKKSAFYWMSVVTIILFFAGLVIYLTTLELGVRGDGHEYIMQTVAFQNHFSFGITSADVEEAKEQFYDNQKGIEKTYATAFSQSSGNMACDERGVVYSNHFGAYSALVTIVKLVLIKLNVYPLWAFSITNLILWMAAILVIFFCLKVDDKKKFCVLILIMLNPVFYYLSWVHTEMYIFAFEVIGLVFLYNKQYALSILALSVSAMQNLGVLPMAAVVGIAYILDCYDKYTSEKSDKNILRFMRAYWWKIVPYGFCYLPAFCPIIMTYVRFGVFNRVASIATENKYMFHKAIDYLFDLNLGIFPYEPIILIGFIVLIIVGIKKCPRDAILNLLGVIGILYIIAHQKQINSSMQGINRYCVWIIPIMIFYVVLHCQPTGKAGKGLVVAVLQGVYTAVIVSYCVWFGGAYTPYQFANWTQVLIDVAPQLYNPTHGIFYTRTRGKETYTWLEPMVYTNEQGYVRKILVNEAAKTQFFDDSYFLLDDKGNQIDKNTLKGHAVDDGVYVYYNFNGKIRWLSKCLEYELGDTIGTIYFYSDQYNADAYVQMGLSSKEENGSWTNGDEFIMDFTLDDTSFPLIGISMDVGNTFYHPQSISILINGKEVYQNTVEGKTNIEFIFENPRTDIIELTMLLPDSVVPAEIMESKDLRDLGLMLSTMKIVKAECELSEIPNDGIIHFAGGDYNANLYVLDGIAPPEKEAAWTLGNRMLAQFALTNSSTNADTVHVSMDLESVSTGQQDISISIKGEDVFEGIVTEGENAISFDIPYPEEGYILMAVNIPDAVSPLELGASDDSRKLGLMIKNIKFVVE